MISSNDKQRVFYIGANGSGKTRALKKHQQNSRSNSLFFDETGVCNTLVDKSKVLIQDNFYIYNSEGDRGKREKDPNKNEKINENLLEPLKKIRGILDKLRSFKSSPGIDKLKVITDELLTRNLNRINIIIIDEPENFLDDENLKVLTEILLVFFELNISLIFATHSSRFLELNRAIPDEIILLKELKKIRNEYSQIQDMFESISTNIISGDNIFFSGHKCNNMKLKLKLKGKPLEIFLKSFLLSQEYYRCLFYDEVTLAEGLTEKILISSIHSSKVGNKNFYFTNGKIFIQFYIELFRMYQLKVKALFDSDKKDNEQESSPASLLTDHLIRAYENDPNVRLIISQGKELENDYGINAENRNRFRAASGLSSTDSKAYFFKPYLALYGIIEKGLQDKFIESLEHPKITNEYELK